MKSRKMEEKTERKVATESNKNNLNHQRQKIVNSLKKGTFEALSYCSVCSSGQRAETQLKQNEVHATRKSFNLLFSAPHTQNTHHTGIVCKRCEPQFVSESTQQQKASTK